MSTSFIFMSDTHYGRRPGERSDYSLFAGLLQESVSRIRADASAQDAAYSGLQPLLVLGGDIVNSRDRQKEWDEFFEAGGDLLKQMRVITAMGNRGRRPAADYRRLFDLPAGGPDWPDADPLFYSIDHGCCHFLVLDTNVIDAGSPDGLLLMEDWIRTDLEQSSKHCTFVLMHHPMFTVGTSEEDERKAEVMQRTVLPLLEEYGVDMILCGHQHMYCRSKPYHAGWLGEKDPGLIQIMSVAGTKYFDAWERSGMDKICEFGSNATIISTDERQVTLQTIDPEGNVLDRMVRPVRRKEKTKTPE